MQQRHPHGRAGRRGPALLLQPGPAAPQGQQQAAQRGTARGVQAGLGQQPQDAGAERDSQRHGVNAAYRRQAGQWAFGNLAIADSAPGEAGHDPAAQPFAQRPGRREQQQPAHGGPVVHAYAQPAGQARVQRQVHRQQQRHGPRQQGRHAGDIVQADVDPVKLAGIGGHAPAPADAERALRPTLQQQYQHGERQQRYPVQAVRRKGQYRAGAGQRSQQVEGKTLQHVSPVWLRAVPPAARAGGGCRRG